MISIFYCFVMVGMCFIVFRRNCIHDLYVAWEVFSHCLNLMVINLNHILNPNAFDRYTNSYWINVDKKIYSSIYEYANLKI